MDGIDECIAHHVAEDALRSRILNCLVELNQALGGPYNKSEFRTIWNVRIVPWPSKQGFNIHLRALPGTFDKLRDALAIKLKTDYVKIDCDNVYFADWWPDVKIMLERH